MKAFAFTGEVAHVRPVRQNETARKSEARWSSGVWLGVEPRTGETLVETSESVVRACAVRRVKGDEKSDRTNIEELKVLPRRLVPKREGEGVPTAECRCTLN